MELLNQKKITANKHSASRSGTEQYLDLMPIFKCLKHNAKKTTAKNLPMTGYKKYVTEMFKTLGSDGKLSLSYHKFNALVDFAICLPEVLTASVTRERVQSGFLAAGAIDDKTYQWPDLDRIIHTCQRDVEQKEVDAIINNFSRLCNEFNATGKVSEDTYDDIGLREDTDSNGEVRQRRSNVDAYQRAMTLSADALRDARRKKIEEAKEQKRVKELTRKTKILNMLKDNKSCEEKLECGIQNATLAHFAHRNITKPLLFYR